VTAELQPSVRAATYADLDRIRAIYNAGIEDRVATLETNQKTRDDIERWWGDHHARHPIVVATVVGQIVGWASLNRFSARDAHAGIADLSVYVDRGWRCKGVGRRLLADLIAAAADRGFHKIVLHALNGNEAGKSLYRRCGFEEVGVFRRHGKLDGAFVDVVAMELLL
jgi:L-amino acid N-acyltransferase YncA